MKNPFLATLQNSVSAVALVFGLLISVTRMRAADAAEQGRFPYVIRTELGASEFEAGDRINISSVRGDRKHFEPGGHYVLDGSYTLGSAPAADLAWFSTTRGPSGSTPVSEGEHVKITQGSGNFHLEKTLQDDGWLHVSFYVNGHSHGGVYFGEEGFDKTVLRQKGWSDFSNTAHAEKPEPESAAIEVAGVSPPEKANAAIMAFLGNPVPAPVNLDPKYTPTNLLAVFTTISRKEGWTIQKLSVDDSEFPFLVYGVLAGRHELVAKDIQEIGGYDYGGSCRGSTGSGSTYFSLNMIPRDQYPSEQSAACHRRLMVRLQMLAEIAGRSE